MTEGLKTRAHIVRVYFLAMAHSKLYKHLIIITNDEQNERMKREKHLIIFIYSFVLYLTVSIQFFWTDSTFSI